MALAFGGNIMIKNIGLIFEYSAFDEISQTLPMKGFFCLKYGWFSLGFIGFSKVDFFLFHTIFHKTVNPFSNQKIVTCIP
jgi:hypothetical protein